MYGEKNRNSRSGSAPKLPSPFPAGPPDRPQTTEHTALIDLATTRTRRARLSAFRNKYRLLPGFISCGIPGRGGIGFKSG